MRADEDVLDARQRRDVTARLRPQDVDATTSGVQGAGCGVPAAVEGAHR